MKSISDGFGAKDLAFYKNQFKPSQLGNLINSQLRRMVYKGKI
jgi:hypothetical protein